MAVVNSSLFYVWYISLSDGFHLNDSRVRDLPIVDSLFNNKTLENVANRLEEDITRNAFFSTRNTSKDQIEIEAFKMSVSKPIIDDIDRVLAKHYRFTEEELDFIINYDIKYRMGKELDAEE